MAGGSRLGPFTEDAVRPAVTRVIVDFLRSNLLHDTGATADFSVAATVDGLRLTKS